MKYNIVGNITNKSGAQHELTQQELAYLVDGDVFTPVITVSGGDSVYIVCDLNNRFDLYSLEYYHSGVGDVIISASDSVGVWYDVEHSVTISGSTAITGLANINPRWLRIQHSVTTGEVNIYELSMYNEDGNILFGENGSFDSYGMDTTGLIIQRVDVFNPTSVVRDINVFVENDESSDADELLTIGSTTSTLYSKRELGVNIPDNFSWDNGSHINTEVVDNKLVVSGTQASGTYYSPVLDLSSFEDYRFFWDYAGDGYNSINYGNIGSNDCFGVRRYNIPPSGTWTSGVLAEDYDSYWSLDVGQLEFKSVPNNTILELGPWDYMQFAITITGEAMIHSAGIEAPVVIQDVQPNSYKDLYISSISGTTSGKTAHLQCWYTE